VLRTDLLIGLGTAQRLAGDPTHRATLLEAAEHARRLGDTERVVTAALANNRGYFSSIGSLDLERVEILRAALDALGGEDRPERARLLAAVAVELAAEGDWEHHRHIADEALAIARRLGDPATLAQVLIMRYLAINVPETLELRLAETAEACALTESLSDPVAESFAAVFRVWAAIQAGDLPEVDRRLDQIQARASQLGQPLVDHWLNLHRSWRALLAGDQQEAEALAIQALRVAEASGNPEGRIFYAGQLFAIRMVQGRLDELVDLVAQVAADTPGVPVFRSTLATTLCELDRDDEARRLLEAEAADGFRAHPRNYEWLHAMTRWANICVHLGDQNSADLLYGRLAPFAGQMAFSGVTFGGSVAHPLGNLAALLGRFDEAQDHLANAARAHEQLGDAYHLALTRLSWARLLLRRSIDGDAARAAQLAALALDAARRHGFGTIQRRLAALVQADLPT